jgi:hypothetical protein
MEILLSFAGCIALLVALAFVILVSIWLTRSNMRTSDAFDQARQARLNELRKRGITAPAVVVTSRVGGKDGHTMQVKFEIDVQPEGLPAFSAAFQDWLNAGGNFTPNRDRPEDVGKKIWVTYDPANPSEMMFEYYDYARKYILGRPKFNEVEKRDAQLRKTGEEAVAVILETEDLELTDDVEKEQLQKTTMRLKLEVTPKSGESYQAEAQGMFVNSGLHKYVVGKKVIVKFNPLDKNQVALVGAFEVN